MRRYEDGCEQCSCYDPCENMNCPQGSKCSVELIRTAGGISEQVRFEAICQEGNSMEPFVNMILSV